MVLKIDDHGFEDTRLNVGRVPWSAVETIGADTAGNELSDQAAYVFVELKSSTEHSVRKRDGKPVRRIAIWTTPMGVDGYHLARVFEARQRRAIVSPE